MSSTSRAVIATRFKAPVLKFDAGRPFLYRHGKNVIYFNILKGAFVRFDLGWFQRVPRRLGPKLGPCRGPRRAAAVGVGWLANSPRTMRGSILKMDTSI